jgi:hypothetical protein
MLSIDLNDKFIEIIHNIIQAQNVQLLKIIAEEQRLDAEELQKRYVLSRNQFKKLLRSTTTTLKSDCDHKII